MELLLDHCLLVPTDDNCRICVAHLDGDHLIKGLEVTRTFLKDADDPDDQQATLDPLEAATVIEDLIHAVRTYRSMSHLSFDNEGALNDEEYQLWTGWTKDQFNSFLQHLQGMRNSKQRSIRTSLAIFWIKLKTDLSFGHIASLLGIKRGDSEAGRLIAAEAFHAVENLLAANFVQLHLGPAHMTPEEAKKHNTVYSRTFFGERSQTIWDGTYLYTYKSSNYAINRKFYSMHKHRPLAKFMSIVLPDGYVLETIGPFFSDGKNNDAGMTLKILQEESTGMLQWLTDGEQVVIVDRGFRNVIVDLENYPNISVKMPTVSNGHQDSVSQANQTRLVTKVRWVVESYHGRFKKFKFFENRQPIAFVNNYRSLLRILTAGLNAFRPPLLDTSIEEKKHQQIADLMLQRSLLTENNLGARVAKGPLSSRGGHWEDIPIDEAELDVWNVVNDFPILSLDTIETTITLGSYQLKQAQHYADEHLQQQGGFRVSVHREARNLIRCRLQSRHSNSTKYFVWIEFERHCRRNPGKVTGWYCQCKAGQRLVGCCAHATAMIWYLGYARHHGYQVSPNLLHLWGTVIDSKDTGVDDSDEEMPSDSI